MASASPKPKYIYELPYIPQRDLANILDDNNQWKELGTLKIQLLGLNLLFTVLFACLQ
jgi:hypothetical protein